MYYSPRWYDPFLMMWWKFTEWRKAKKAKKAP